MFMFLILHFLTHTVLCYRRIFQSNILSDFLSILLGYMYEGAKLVWKLGLIWICQFRVLYRIDKYRNSSLKHILRDISQPGRVFLFKTNFGFNMLYRLYVYIKKTSCFLIAYLLFIWVFTLFYSKHFENVLRL